MGFENRKSVRVKLPTQCYFWRGESADGPGTWGQGQNLSATGVAFTCTSTGEIGEGVFIELSLPGQKGHVRVAGTVVHCERDPKGEEFQWRVNFKKLEGEEREQVRAYVLELAEPGTGWGRAYFQGQGAIDLKYKELSAADREQWLLKRAYLSMKELGYLKNFQSMLQHALGAGFVEGFKLIGSRPLKDGSDVWIELDLALGQLHFLGKTLWCRHETGEKPELGIQMTACHKDEAMKLEKEF